MNSQKENLQKGIQARRPTYINPSEDIKSALFETSRNILTNGSFQNLFFQEEIMRHCVTPKPNISYPIHQASNHIYT